VGVDVIYRSAVAGMGRFLVRVFCFLRLGGHLYTSFVVSHLADLGTGKCRGIELFTFT
jgi:hypothetical protein